jgi:hypothetical protein
VQKVGFCEVVTSQTTKFVKVSFKSIIGVENAGPSLEKSGGERELWGRLGSERESDVVGRVGAVRKVGEEGRIGGVRRVVGTTEVARGVEGEDKE